VIPSWVRVLDHQSFSDRKSLASVTFGIDSRIERIHEYTFSWSRLKSIVIPPNVAFISGSAFATNSLSSISVSPDNQHFRIRESFLEDRDGSTIYRYFGSAHAIMIPSSVVVLGDWCFFACKSLECVNFQSDSRLERIDEWAFRESGLRSIVIPSSVVVLGRSSFFECKSLGFVRFGRDSRLERVEESAFYGNEPPPNQLKSIEIPSSVVVLGKWCFHQCQSLESVAFESGSRLKKIGGAAFEGSKLKSIQIPSCVVVLGKRSFSWCKALESVTFESGSRLEQIKEGVFSCSGLKSIVIPQHVAFLCGSAFAAEFLTSISISPDNQHFRIRESFLEDICGSTIYRYFGSAHSIMIPSSVVVLDEESFSYCTSLEYVIFESPSRLEGIGAHAFSESGLKRIVLPSALVPLGKACFGKCKSLESVTSGDGCQLGRIEEFPLSDRLSKWDEQTRTWKFVRPGPRWEEGTRAWRFMGPDGKYGEVQESAVQRALRHSATPQ
jgi:hypothetical protein